MELTIEVTVGVNLVLDNGCTEFTHMTTLAQTIHDNVNRYLPVTFRLPNGTTYRVTEINTTADVL